jgi:hypothetical protein
VLDAIFFALVDVASNSSDPKAQILEAITVSSLLSHRLLSHTVSSHNSIARLSYSVIGLDVILT